MPIVIDRIIKTISRIINFFFLQKKYFYYIHFLTSFMTM